MTSPEAKEILLKMAFCESTDFIKDRLFGFGYSEEHEALLMAAEALTTQDKIDYFIDYVKTNWLQYKYIEVADMLSILERLKVKGD